VLSDPISVTYNGSGKSLARTGQDQLQNVYRTADGEFEVVISSSSDSDGVERREITLARRLPDATPSNAFDAYREIRNVFGLSYAFDSTRAEASVDIPLLRTALLAFVDSTLQGRIIAGEK
jgi:hypothetical protein